MKLVEEQILGFTLNGQVPCRAEVTSPLGMDGFGEISILV